MKDKKHLDGAEQHIATAEEIREALDRLTDVDLNRLQVFARWRVRGLGWKAKGRTWEDLLHEAVESALSRTRKWNKNSIAFKKFLIGSMRSISSHWVEHSRSRETPTEPSKALALAANPRVGQAASTSSQPTPEEILASEQAEFASKKRIEEIRTLVSDDQVVLDIMDGLMDDMSGTDIREILGLSRTQYETAMKRLRRRAHNAFPAKESDDA